MNNDAIIEKLLEHDERLERIEKNMATKSDLVGFKDSVLTMLDQQMVILQRLDQERIFTHEWVRRN